MQTEIQQLFAGKFEQGLMNELGALTPIHLPKGSVLRQPENSWLRYTPIILQGSIKVTRINEQAKEIIMYFIKPGETCFLTVTASLASNFQNIESLRAVTEEDTLMVSISDEQIRLWNDKYRSWRTFIYEIYNARFAEFFTLVDSIAFKSVDLRLMDKLKDLAMQSNPIHITHVELAKSLGTAREVVSRLLKKLELDGKVELGRNEVLLV